MNPISRRVERILLLIYFFSAISNNVNMEESGFDNYPAKKHGDKPNSSNVDSVIGTDLLHNSESPTNYNDERFTDAGSTEAISMESSNTSKNSCPSLDRGRLFLETYNNQPGPSSLDKSDSDEDKGSLKIISYNLQMVDNYLELKNNWWNREKFLSDFIIRLEKITQAEVIVFQEVFSLSASNIISQGSIKNLFPYQTPVLGQHIKMTKRTFDVMNENKKTKTFLRRNIHAENDSTDQSENIDLISSDSDYRIPKFLVHQHVNAIYYNKHNGHDHYIDYSSLKKCIKQRKETYLELENCKDSLVKCVLSKDKESYELYKQIFNDCITKFCTENDDYENKSKGWDSIFGRFSNLTFQNGGILVISKYPILEQHAYIFSNRVFPDFLSNKGAVYTCIEKYNKRYNIVTTHFQAGNSNNNIRLLQAFEIVSWLKMANQNYLKNCRHENCNQYNVCKGDQSLEETEYNSVSSPESAVSATAFNPNDRCNSVSCGDVECVSSPQNEDDNHGQQPLTSFSYIRKKLLCIIEKKRKSIIENILSNGILDENQAQNFLKITYHNNDCKARPCFHLDKKDPLIFAGDFNFRYIEDNAYLNIALSKKFFNGKVCLDDNKLPQTTYDTELNIVTKLNIGIRPTRSLLDYFILSKDHSGRFLKHQCPVRFVMESNTIPFRIYKYLWVRTKTVYVDQISDHFPLFTQISHD